MEALVIVLIVLDIIACIAMIGIVLVQSGKSAGLSGAIAGAADSFMSKGKSRTLDAKLATATKWVAGVFAVISLVLCMLVNYVH